VATEGTIIVSDKRGRLKPCLRCGYSLIRIAGARNCPECGLAVRVSLSNDKSLSWSNPRWQRSLAVAFGLLAFGFFCTIISSVGSWFAYGADESYYTLDNAVIQALYQFSRLIGELSPIICGMALCLLAKGERRYPDTSVGARRITLGAGIFVLVVGLLKASLRHGLWRFLPPWGSEIFYRTVYGPWIPLIITILTCSYSKSLAKRGQAPLLSKVSQAPIYVSAAGFWVWLLSLDRFFWPLRSIVWDWLFPLSMIAMLMLTVRVLLSNAREAELNWTTDE
jgi:hypothetical protein